jgi:hypothetical protein
MNDDTQSPGNDVATKPRQVDPTKKLEQIEKDHGENKSPKELADEAFSKDDGPIELPEAVGDNPVKKKKFRKPLSKIEKIIMAVVIVVLLAALGGSYYWFFMRPNPSHNAKPAPKVEVKPTTEPSKLTGREVPPETNKRQVTGVMIENSPDARPQSGLVDAGLVFEAIAEGGITRFLALYQDTQPAYIGPIRSARPYYLDWVLAFDASLAHVGGSPDALAAIKSQGVKDLDQFVNAGGYQRVSNRFAPHNVYSSIASLNKIEQSKGYTTSNFEGFKRKKKESPSAQPTAKSVDFSISSFLYNSHWDYDAPSNSYVRSQGGKFHTDEKTGQAISPKVLIALVTSKGVASDGYHTTYATAGNGKLFLFQDGGVAQGTWEKASAKQQFVFKDSAGQPFDLNAGQTWITIVASSDQVTYKP